MFKAVFTDMDGTLLRKDHTVSDVTKQAIQKLIAEGILVVPISARPLHGMLPITSHVFPANLPIVSLNGSYIYHKKEIIYQINMPLAETALLHEITMDYPVSVMYYSQMDWFAHNETAAVIKEQRITDVAITIQPFIQTLQGWQQQQTGPNKILIAGDEAMILSVEEKLLNEFSGRLNINKSQPRYLEAMHPAASKSNAIRFLIESYGFKQEEIIAIGDNFNDQGMIEFAGTGVAMGNAPDAIKAVANYVTDSNENDGVAKALEYFFPTIL